MDITALLTYAVQHGASDLHLSAGMPPIVRIDGELQPMDVSCLDHEQIQQLILSIMDQQQGHNFITEREIDFAFELPKVSRFRINAFHQNRGASAVFRIISSQILSMEQLALPAIFQQICEYPRGIVLVTGPTGSGKSTTLAAMIDYINHHYCKHILSIEDPIEFIHQSKKCLINQREIYRDTLGLNQALHAALREDPDIILIGEMRDAETMRLALTAAETGHLVFATLHTSSATKTIDRIIDTFSAQEKDSVRAMLAESLQAVISQILLKKQHQGRVAAHEIMIAIPAIRNLIRENKIAQMYSVLQTGAVYGMQTLDQSLKHLLHQGTITLQTARSLAKQPEMFK
ncbi:MULTISPECIES: type IV pilus twitching motility protein PilT [unclassified Acinetobacter]|uniref:type IV pilus twitching motility protein PilT n=1 Tax=unclassified Acinetobacter TaxID=196816 RepID=UPI002934721B|nr:MULTISPECIES: type IV pilus twitching motility protein PilT [unclassified Acinetobacter]WOE32980.1 type IV pilus twitching motility protein PilT [Acinetobacter sp. SAAs470]WOE38458.1 type IV pilus twitching motility protein PilT [Acinetobacter sp. SAAs474]